MRFQNQVRNSNIGARLTNKLCSDTSSMHSCLPEMISFVQNGFRNSENRKSDDFSTTIKRSSRPRSHPTYGSACSNIMEFLTTSILRPHRIDRQFDFNKVLLSGSASLNLHQVNTISSNVYQGNSQVCASTSDQRSASSNLNFVVLS